MQHNKGQTFKDGFVIYADTWFDKPFKDTLTSRALYVDG